MSGATFLHFIGNRFVPSQSERYFDKRSPVDGSLVGTVAEGGQDEVHAAVQAARAALSGPWGRLTLPQRTDMLHGVAREIDRRFDDFLDAEVHDTGKPRSIASHVDIPRGAANFRVFADAVKNVPTEFFEMTTPEGRKAFNYSVRAPKGVIAVVCPWNLPLLLMTWKVAPALACGNTVVVKPSEETPATATLLGEVMQIVGVPPGVYNVVHGFGAASAGEFLTRHPDVSAITFTGETATGAAIMKAAADGIRAVSLELGGKNPGIVFADCDLDAAAAGISRAAFLNTGQICLGTERIYVERPIFERFVAAQNAHDEKEVSDLLIDTSDFLWITRGTAVWGRDAAMKRFERALSTSQSDRVGVRLAVGHLMLNQGDVAGAKRQITLAMMEAGSGRAQPPTGTQLAQAADLFLGMHEYELAETYFSRALAAGAPETEVRLGMANTYLALGDTPRAAARRRTPRRRRSGAPRGQDRAGLRHHRAHPVRLLVGQLDQAVG